MWARLCLILLSLGMWAVSARTEGKEMSEHAERSARPGNRLAGELSPYLQQHSQNPVDWYPWGEEALERARREDKPIFLSIGYAACHWCHVMERESFENEEIAAILNRHFVSIKVDREERPDLDSLYMTAVQALTGRGGWPLSVFLTPQLEPFFGGTYFPPQSRYGMPGFGSVLQSVARAWSERRSDVTQSAAELTVALRQSVDAEGFGPATDKGEGTDAEVFRQVAAEFAGSFDETWGGFGGAPKFPPAGAVSLLLRRYARHGDQTLLRMAELTLDRMAAGGMRDQLGGGFHRYSVDREWKVPHFEKMLYDNALLSAVYIEAYQVTKKEAYRRVAEETLDYVLRDMVDSGGGFHSSEDADSDGKEGTFYIWDPEEVRTVLGDKDAALFAERFGMNRGPNFEGQSILYLAVPLSACAASHDIDEEECFRWIESGRRRLLEVRNRRERPFRDDKVIVAWNALMISSLAKAYQALNEPRYLDAAQIAIDFIREHMTSGDGGLRRVYRDGQTGAGGYLDDYANLCLAYLDMYESTFDEGLLHEADRLAEAMIRRFGDKENGGFFLAPADDPSVLVRTKPTMDASVPSGNATASMALLRLGRLLDKPAYLDSAERILAAVRPTMAAHPESFPHLLLALDFQAASPIEIGIVGAPDVGSDAMVRRIRSVFLPQKVLAYADSDAAAESHVAPWMRGKTVCEGRATAYLCEGYSCQEPLTSAVRLEARLREAAEVGDSEGDSP